MGRRAARRPASARTLYRALDGLGAAPTPDPVLRPNGPKRGDTALLLGVLLAKTELDAAVRADPAQEPPRGMTGLLTGYHSLVTSLGDTTRLRLLSLRLVRSAVEATLDDDTDPVLLAAAGLIDTARLQNTGASPAAIRAAHDAAALSLRAAAGQALPTPHHHEPAEGGRRQRSPFCVRTMADPLENAEAETSVFGTDLVPGRQSGGSSHTVALILVCPCPAVWGVKYPTRPARVPKHAIVPSGTSALREPRLVFSSSAHSSRRGMPLPSWTTMV
ncbi:hypothetical protein [Streptomyces bacillaris]|uniref:hypothetical protein n=1 Tax=Streptomyces bacillaris TaxID=68179 RepID=UPI00380A730F